MTPFPGHVVAGMNVTPSLNGGSAPTPAPIAQQPLQGQGAMEQPTSPAGGGPFNPWKQGPA
jgi:hypothetical protein